MLAVYLVALLSCLVQCNALRLPSPHPSVHTNWLQGDRVSPDFPVSLTIALKQQNLQWLEDTVLSVSSPFSPRYGKYLTIEEIAEKIAPAPGTVEKIEQWALSSGAIEVHLSQSRDFMEVVFPASVIESLFDIKFHTFRHAASARTLVRTKDSIVLPDTIAPFVDIITGLTDFFDYPSERTARKKQLAFSSINAAATNAPSILKIKGSEQDLTVFTIVYCNDGTLAGDFPEPCKGHGASPSFVTVFAGGNYVSVPVGAANCGFSSPMLICEVDISVAPYQRVNVTAMTIFEGGAKSEEFKYPTAFAPSPWVTPQYIYDLYKIPQGYTSDHPANSQSVVAFEEQYISLDDLKLFFSSLGLPNKVPIIVGQNDPSNPGGESTLDIQYIMAIGAGVNTTFWSVTGPGPAKPPGKGAYVLEWALQIANTTTAPLVTSISYGDTEQGFYAKFGNYDYITRTNNELAKMAARGLTVVAGSGDAGASNVGEAGNDISDTDPTCTPMRPFFPSNSPYVVSVSATFPAIDALPICHRNYSRHPILCEQVGEVAVGVSHGVDWTTGGGFSNLTGTLSWQKKMVAQFLELSKGNLPPSQYWNSAGRGYPDISTLGRNLICILGGSVDPCSGTSASGPVLGGFFSLLNEIRLDHGLPTIGLPTPLLYHLQGDNHSDYFKDVVVGDNFSGDIQQRGSPYPTYCPYGFSTQPGWDAVTGLGSPNFETLSAAFAVPPSKLFKQQK